MSKSSYDLIVDSRTSTCFGSQFTCVESRDCIDMSWVCDGEGDCGDDSDESPLLCGKSYYQ